MASLPYPRTLLQQCSPTDFTDLHRWLGCVVGSHRIHRIHRSLLLRRNSNRFVGGYGIPAIPTHPATAMFSHRFHGFTQMVRLRSGLPQNSQNSQKFIAEKELQQICRRVWHPCHTHAPCYSNVLPQNSQNSQKFIAEKELPQICRRVWHPCHTHTPCYSNVLPQISQIYTDG